MKNIFTLCVLASLCNTTIPMEQITTPVKRTKSETDLLITNTVKARSKRLSGQQVPQELISQLEQAAAKKASEHNTILNVHNK